MPSTTLITILGAFILAFAWLLRNRTFNRVRPQSVKIEISKSLCSKDR